MPDGLTREQQINLAWQLHHATKMATVQLVRLNYDDRAFVIANWAQMDSRVKRSLLAGEQGWRCCYCGVRMDYKPRVWPHGATIEHVMPRMLGGADQYDNCAAACRQCNETRGTWTNGQQLRSAGLDTDQPRGGADRDRP